MDNHGFGKHSAAILCFLTVAVCTNYAEGLEKYINEAVDFASIKNINAILQLDVVSYYGLEDVYGTDLKKQVFKKSQDYADRLTELKKERADLTNKILYVGSKDSFEYSPYNVSKGEFQFPICLNYGFGLFEARPPNSWDNVVFEIVPTITLPDTLLGAGAVRYCISLKVGEDTALKIENNASNSYLYIFFQLEEKMQNVEFSYLNIADGGWYQMNGSAPRAKYARVVIADKTSDTIYHEREYRTKSK